MTLSPSREKYLRVPQLLKCNLKLIANASQHVELGFRRSIQVADQILFWPRNSNVEAVRIFILPATWVTYFGEVERVRGTDVNISDTIKDTVADCGLIVERPCFFQRLCELKACLTKPFVLILMVHALHLSEDMGRRV